MRLEAAANCSACVVLFRFWRGPSSVAVELVIAELVSLCSMLVPEISAVGGCAARGGLFFDLERRAVKYLVEGFKQCFKCTSFLHEKETAKWTGCCIRCGGAHYDPRCAEPRRCSVCARFRPNSKLDHIAIGPSCPLRCDVQTGKVKPADLKEQA